MSYLDHSKGSPYMDIKPIETRYAGCRFRSRLEARWAVFFDRLGIRWEYEPDGYQLPSGPYLPDFWLPAVSALSGHGVWFEVKPLIDHMVYEDARWGELVEASGRSLIVAYGLTPLENLQPHGFYPDNMDEYMPCPEEGFGMDASRAFCICHPCNQFGITFNGYVSRIECRHVNREDDGKLGSVDPGIVAAYVAAHSARFEFGESG